jgi:fatty acid desaturase
VLEHQALQPVPARLWIRGPVVRDDETGGEGYLARDYLLWRIQTLAEPTPDESTAADASYTFNVRDVLSPEALQQITRRSDWRAAWLVTAQWTIVILIFAAVAWWTNPLTIVLGTLLLGGRQLGFGILDHECGHRTLFSNPAVNDFVGDWLCAPPGFNNVRAYMRGHLQHHRLAGTADDPDLPNYRDYPISRQRLRRKLKRDITGRTGWRSIKRIGLAIAHLPRLDPENRACVLRGLAVNGLMLGVLIAFGHGWLYLMWIGAMVFVQPLVSRIRQVAEHAAVPDLYHPDPRLNTRTVYDNPLTRLMFCPHGVNYHLEHHCMASVPIYNLRKMHRMLRDKGFYEGVRFPRGYLDMLRQVTYPGPDAAVA